MMSGRRERDPYADVGASTRAAIETAIATAEGREFTRVARVFLAALHMTSSRSRLADTVYLAQLTEIARIAGDIDGKHTADALHLLEGRGALLWRPSSIPGKPSLIGLPASLAQQLPILSSVHEPVDKPVDTRGATRDARGATKTASGGPLRPESDPLSGPPSEKDREV